MKAGLLDGARKPPRPGRNGWRGWWRSGTGCPPLEETVARIDAVTLSGLRDHAGALLATPRAAMALLRAGQGGPPISPQVTARLAA